MQERMKALPGHRAGQRSGYRAGTLPTGNSPASDAAAAFGAVPDGYHLDQLTIDDLGTPLIDVTFVVVDLETTGAAASANAITEIGAVKVRGGEQLGEFQSLVKPEGEPISPFITALTGISNAMVANAPSTATVLPMFFEFARGSVLVAHNAPFDIGFLKAAAKALEIPWPNFQAIDTVKLARATVSKDEVRNHKLSTLAGFFGASTVPDHRALADAKATVDVLHGIIGRLGSQGISSLEELSQVTSTVTATQRRKSYLADGLPTGPGVYLFTDGAGRILYIGTSGNVRNRVKNYFTSSERRSRMSEMVGIAEKVTAISCSTLLEAQVRELRLIAEHKPPYNRRSRLPERAPWVKLTVEDFPRLSIVRKVSDDTGDGAAYLGPFSSQRTAEAVVISLQDTFALRRCRKPLSAGTIAGHLPCPAAEIGKCGGPCAGITDTAAYSAVVDEVRAAMTGRTSTVEGQLHSRIAKLAAQQRYEEAAESRDALIGFLRSYQRTDEARMLAECDEIAAARRISSGRLAGGWEIVLVRYGRLAGTTVCRPGDNPRAALAALAHTAESVERPPAPLTAALPAESTMVARWLAEEGVRLVEVSGLLRCTVSPAHSALVRLTA
ncbi:DEDD exonuclease domain-containing protein [Saxibacter everestensis]|uniref:DEDD exonuclease domain-containing protein n=1 Tax=Saxibacter everestensis TaxID=2909229 RepID=A0ABY8QWV6_9MICO|nr:DEDD exonuclease domain-containing protein [Brevibacteriaceae bacterium ZFBP1038]